MKNLFILILITALWWNIDPDPVQTIQKLETKVIKLITKDISK